MNFFYRKHVTSFTIMILFTLTLPPGHWCPVGFTLRSVPFVTSLYPFDLLSLCLTLSMSSHHKPDRVLEGFEVKRTVVEDPTVYR